MRRAPKAFKSFWMCSPMQPSGKPWWELLPKLSLGFLAPNRPQEPLSFSLCFFPFFKNPPRYWISGNDTSSGWLSHSAVVTDFYFFVKYLGNMLVKGDWILKYVFWWVGVYQKNNVFRKHSLACSTYSSPSIFQRFVQEPLLLKCHTWSSNPSTGKKKTTNLPSNKSSCYFGSFLSLHL